MQKTNSSAAAAAPPAVDALANTELAVRLATDESARRRALEIASFIVEAPAGAGKTELLTQRFLRLLATVDAPEEVVAITFTNKAAAEMRARILRSLHAAAAGDEPPEAHRRITYALAKAVLASAAERDWALLEQPGRLRILTIDALCASLARQMPLLSRFGAQPVVSTEPQPLYEEAVRQTLALLESDNAALSEPVAASLAYLDNDFARLSRLLVGMLERRDQWLKPLLPHDSLAAASERLLAELVAGEIAETAALFDARLQSRLMPIARFAADSLFCAGKESPIGALLDWQEVLPVDAEALSRWRGVAELLLTKDGGWRKSFTVAIGLPAGKEGKAWKEALGALIEDAAQTPGMAAAFDQLRSLPLLADHADEDAIVQTFVDLLRLAAANLLDVFRMHGACDFVEVAQRSLLALADERGPTDLALKLDYKIQHLLVDEFQDTSPTQVELLQRLTAGWNDGDGRTLFCVGDPMQSIYRFRKADVGLFLRAAQHGIGDLRLEALRLYRNNRSCGEVVAWINGAFGQIFPRRDHIPRGAIAYRPFVATRASLPDAGVGVHAVVPPEDALGEDCAQLEAQRILTLIEATWQDDASREIAVLVRSRRHLDPLVSEIRRSRPGLRFQAVDIESLAGRQWIDDLLILTRALLHRADRLSWLALLRSPLCGLRLADLHALAGGSPHATVWSQLRHALAAGSLSDDGTQRAARLEAVLAAAFAERGRQHLARWIEAVWLSLGGPATLPDAAAAQDAEAFFKLVETLDEAREFSLDRLPEKVACLFAAPDPAADGRLKLMTIHKAKGLEFDTVILPGLSRKVAGNDADLLRWEEVVRADGSAELVVAPLAPRRQKSATPTAYSFLQRLENQRADNEDLRVLYVAATRAVRALHLVAVIEFDAATGSAKVPAGTPLASFWPAVGGHFCGNAEPAAAGSNSCKTSPTAVSWEAFVPPLLRQPLDAFAAACVARAATPATRRAGLGEPEPAQIEAAVGSLVHRYLELIAKSGLAGWSAERTETLLSPMQRFLRQQGLSKRQAEQGAERAKAMLRRVLDSQVGRWLLAPHPQAAAELALAAAGPGKAAAEVAVIDRTFVIDGERWIVDYKTGAVPAGSDASALTRLAEAHRPQLARYGALFAAEARPQRWAIFFTDGISPALVELPVGQVK
jgi:ATP-dependent helicase/nuclease subunit A